MVKPSAVGPATGNTEGDDFEVRADHVEEGLIRRETVMGDWFDKVHSALEDRSLTLIVGPRGCGKTHMMRFTHLRCRDDRSLPLAIYVSFNRYLRLEPLLKARSDAGSLFHTWVLARLLISLHETVERLADLHSLQPFPDLGFDLTRLQALAARLERGIPLSVDEEEDASSLSVEGVVETIRRACQAARRKRSILLMDDAALTLTPEFLIEFFDVVRAVKRTDIAPKCSVYPGTTEYGPRFHAEHEGQTLNVWLSTDHPKYTDIMGQIGRSRYPEGVAGLSPEFNETLMYTAFGVPRAYLSLVRSVVVAKSEAPQRALNRAIQEHRDAKVSEYQSLEKKVPKFATVVRMGSLFFDHAVQEIKLANDELAGKREEKQLQIGIEKEEFRGLSKRMIQFLNEAGLIYEHPEVSHGEDRKYRRFTPHLAALIAGRAFAGRSRGAVAGATVEFLRLKRTKHPVRKRLETFLPPGAIDSLSIDLPPCQNCSAPRVTNEQKFCINCGTRLADPSTFTRLMELSVGEVPGLSPFQKAKCEEAGIKTIKDLISLSDPGTELRRMHLIGGIRATKIIRTIEAYVDEFLS